MTTPWTKGPIRITKCPCGHPNCTQYTLSTQQSVGFELADARLYAAAPEMADLLAQFVDAFRYVDPRKGSTVFEARALLAKITETEPSP